MSQDRDFQMKNTKNDNNNNNLTQKLFPEWQKFSMFSEANRSRTQRLTSTIDRQQFVGRLSMNNMDGS